MTCWTQDDAVAFECAREVISDMMALQTHQIAEESAKAQPDGVRVAQLRAERSRLALERAGLHVGDRDKVARVRAEYGAFVRAWRTANEAVDA